MKIYKIFILAIVALMGCISCGGDTPDNPTIKWSKSGSPIGEWRLNEWNGSAELPFGVYLRLNEDKSFDLYQHTYSVLWIHYSGTYSINNSVLSGTYSDGEQWGSTYSIEYNEANHLIRLTRIGSESRDVSIYSATTIPNEVEEDATEAVNVRSVAIDPLL